MKSKKEKICTQLERIDVSNEWSNKKNKNKKTYKKELQKKSKVFYDNPPSTGSNITKLN